VGCPSLSSGLGKSLILMRESPSRGVKHMPLVMVHLWPGRDADTKRRIVEGITKVFENEKIPRDAVEVILIDVPKSNWASGGKLYSD
jgi:4-oxalocrotonate tautomerase